LHLTPIKPLQKKAILLEAMAGTGRLKRRIHIKNALFFRLIKHNTGATQTSTFAAPLLTFLLTVG
jgi:hypothetical protein